MNVTSIRTENARDKISLTIVDTDVYMNKSGRLNISQFQK